MNQAVGKLYSVKDVPMIYKREFGEDLNFYDMLEMVDHILIMCGSIAPKYYLFKGTVADFELNLPCNVYAIKHVTNSKPTSWYSGWLLGQDINALINYRVDQSGNHGHFNEDATTEDEDQDDVPKVYEINKNIFSEPLGELIDFENDNNCCLKFNWREKEVDVLYRGKVLDSSGYPMVPEKTLRAIAYYMWYVNIRKKFNMRQADGNMLAVARDEKDIRIAQARTPEALSQNEVDDLLNAATSFNRKRHNFQHRK